MSCISQEISGEYEIICVDDESPDGSVRIIEELMKKYDKIRLIKNSHGGVSHTRNTGIENARGKYIWFVDSDDYIAENSLKFLENVILKNDCDLINFSGESFPFESPDDIMRYFGFVATHLTKRKIIMDNNIRFNSEISFGEDELFAVEVMDKAEKVEDFPDNRLYFYRKNDGSVMANSGKRITERIKSVILQADEVNRKIISGEITSDFSYEFLLKRMESILDFVSFNYITSKEAKKLIKFAKEKKVFRCRYLKEHFPDKKIPSEKDLYITLLKSYFHEIKNYLKIIKRKIKKHSV